MLDSLVRWAGIVFTVILALALLLVLVSVIVFTTQFFFRNFDINVLQSNVVAQTIQHSLRLL